MRNNILSKYKQNSEVTITYSTLPLDSYVAIRVSPKQQVPQQQTNKGVLERHHTQPTPIISRSFRNWIFGNPFVIMSAIMSAVGQ